MTKLNVGFFIYPGVTALDFIGPAQVISQMPGANILLISQQLQPVSTDAGFNVVPTHTFSTCEDLDVLCIPGGPGQAAVMNDADVLNFVREKGSAARFVTSVCTGSLLLAKAGLLDGYRAACHWAWRDLLNEYGAVAEDKRVVIDRNRMTGGGVTAGIDFGLTLVSLIAGDNMAKAIQLGLEYQPQPPFDSGTPNTADPELVARVKNLFETHYALA